jgi:hypothetical protein
MTCRSRRRIILSSFVFFGVAARCLELLHYCTLAQVIILFGESPMGVQQGQSINKQESSSPPLIMTTRRTDTATDRILASTTNHKEEGDDGDDDNSKINQWRQENYKPSLILHVGVHKTGTTTIQTDAAEHFTESLAQDNYVYLGKASENRSGRVIDNTIQNTLRSVRCVDQVLQRAAHVNNNNQNTNYREEEVRNSTTTKNKKMPACWSTLLQELDLYRQHNTSIILSDEDFSHDSLFTRGVYALPGYFHLLSQTLQVDWNVTIVIGYRRYAEWALSSLKQLQDGTCFRQQRGWKHEGGAPCAAPWDYIPEWMHRQPWPSARVYHSYEEQAAMWQSHGFVTKILNFHHASNQPQPEQQQQDLSMTLFCNVLTDTPHTCNSSRNQPRKTKENALGVAEAAYSNIVFAAAERGLLNITDTAMTNATLPPADHLRYRLTRQLLHHHRQQHPLGTSAFRHLPLLCPPQSQLQELLNISLTVEQRFMPTLYHAPGNREEHTRSFWRMANERKELCSVDTETLLEGVSSWASLLANLKSSTR